MAYLFFQKYTCLLQVCPKLDTYCIYKLNNLIISSKVHLELNHFDSENGYSGNNKPVPKVTLPSPPTTVIHYTYFSVLLCVYDSCTFLSWNPFCGSDSCFLHQHMKYQYFSCHVNVRLLLDLRMLISNYYLRIYWLIC